MFGIFEEFQIEIAKQASTQAETLNEYSWSNWLNYNFCFKFVIGFH